MRADVWSMSSSETAPAGCFSTLTAATLPSGHCCTHFGGEQRGSQRGHDFPKSPLLENGRTHLHLSASQTHGISIPNASQSSNPNSTLTIREA